MNWRVIAEHDARRAKESRTIRTVGMLVVLVCVGYGYVFPVLADDPSTTVFAAALSSNMAFVLLVGLLGTLLGYRSVVGDRNTGSLTLLLSLPQSRRDVVLGKLVGRSLVLVVTLIFGLGVAGALVVYPFGSLALGPYLLFVLLTVLYGLAFCSLAVAISVTTKSTHVATSAGFGVLFLFVIAWGNVQDLVTMVLGQFGLTDDEPPRWLEFLFGLEPRSSFELATASFVGTDASNASVYHNEWIALATLLAWCVIPLALALTRFENADL